MDRRVNFSKILRSPITQAVALVIFTLLFSIILASSFNSHIINRFGANLSAIGAALVLYQTAIEARFEKENLNDTILLNKMPPVDVEVLVRIVHKRDKMRKSKRFQIVSAVAIIVFFGELMHGWGDFMYDSILSKDGIKH